MKLFNKIFCCHDWVEKERKNYSNYIFYSKGCEPKPDYINILYVCKKCGKFKTITL